MATKKENIESLLIHDNGYQDSGKGFIYKNILDSYEIEIHVYKTYIRGYVTNLNNISSYIKTPRIFFNGSNERKIILTLHEQLTQKLKEVIK